MGYIGNQTSNSYTSLDKQTITGNGGVNYTLSSAVASQNELEVFVNNVRQEPGVAYTATGTTLTMTGNVESTDDFYVIYQGKAVGTTAPPTGTVATPSTVGSFLGDAGTALGNIIRVHEKELNTSVTVAANTNGLAAGPLTLATGVTITVSTGATLVVA